MTKKLDDLPQKLLEPYLLSMAIINFLRSWLIPHGSSKTELARWLQNISVYPDMGR